VKRLPVSAVLIAKNAAAQLEACLQSITWADEIVLLDSGSTDATVEIAEAMGARVFQSDAWPGFGRQRQLAQSYARYDWLFMIDVDERVTPELQHSIEAVLQNPDPKKVYRFNRLTDFFGRFMRSSGWYPDRVARLYHAAHFGYDNAAVHEKVLCSSSDQVDLEGHLLHYTTPSYRGFIDKSARYACDWAEAKHARGKTTSVAGIIAHTLGTFLRKYLLQRGFLEGRHGFLLASVSSIYTFHKYMALWTLNQNRDTS